MFSQDHYRDHRHSSIYDDGESELQCNDDIIDMVGYSLGA